MDEIQRESVIQRRQGLVVNEHSCGLPLISKTKTNSMELKRSGGNDLLQPVERYRHV